MESQYLFGPSTLAPCTDLSLVDFLGVVCSFQQLVEHCDLQAGPYDLTLGLGETVTQGFLTSCSTTLDGDCLTLKYNKAMFFLSTDVWMVCTDKQGLSEAYNAKTPSVSKLTMYYFLFLYFQSLGGDKYFIAEKYVDKITAEELCKPEFVPANFVIDLIPSVSEMAKRIVDLNRNLFTLAPLQPKFLSKYEVQSNICNPDKKGTNEVDAGIMRDCIKKIGQISKLKFTTSNVYKLPLSPVVYPWVSQPEKCKCSLDQMRSILTYMLMYKYKASVEKMEDQQFLNQFSLVVTLYLEVVHSYNLMIRTLMWNGKDTIPSNLTTKSDVKIPTNSLATWSNKQFKYGFAHFPEETKSTLLKYFQHRIEPNLSEKEIRELGKMDDVSAFNMLRTISQSREKTSVAIYDKGSYRVTELEESGFFSKLASVTSYLDFGGNTGEIAAMIGKRLKLDKDHTHCFDVAFWFDSVRSQSHSDVTTFYSKLNILPYDDETFDFVSSFVTLHHLSQFALSVSELVRVMKDGAIFLVREHDCEPSDLSVVIDLEHSLYEMVEKPQVSYAYLGDYYATYWSKSKLVELLKPFGFVELPEWNIVPKKSKGFSKGPTRYYYNVFKLVKNQVVSEQFIPPPPPEDDESIPPPPEIEFSSTDSSLKSSPRPNKNKQNIFTSLEVAQELERLRSIDKIAKEMTSRFTRNHNTSQAILINYILCMAYDCGTDSEPVYKTSNSPLGDSQLEYDWRRYRLQPSFLPLAKTYLHSAFSNTQREVQNITKPATIDCYDNEFGLDFDADFFLFEDVLNRMNSTSDPKEKSLIAVQIIRNNYLHLETVFNQSPVQPENAFTWFGGSYLNMSKNDWAVLWSDETEFGGKPNPLCNEYELSGLQYIQPPNIYQLVVTTLKRVSSLRSKVNGKDIIFYVPNQTSDATILQHCPRAKIKVVKQEWINPYTKIKGLVSVKQILL